MSHQTCETCRNWGSGQLIEKHAYLPLVAIHKCASKQSPDVGLHWGPNHTCGRWEAREKEEKKP